MNRPHLSVKLCLLTAFAVCLFSVSSGAAHQARAQQTQAKELYETAKRQYAENDYRKSLETIEELLKTDSAYAPAFLLKSRALVGLVMTVPPLRPDEMKVTDVRRERKMRQARLMKEAAESLERFLQLKPDVEGAEGLREELSALRVYAEPAIKPEAEWTIFSPSEVTEKAHILRRPQPRYPEEARAARFSGTVRLLLVFADDGTVKHILVLQSPNRALTEASIEAARKISFEPAIKDGRPVSTVSSVEYGFQTY